MTQSTQQMLEALSKAALDKGDFSVNQRHALLREKFAALMVHPGLSVSPGHSFKGAAPFTKIYAGLTFKKACGDEFYVGLTNEESHHKKTADGHEVILHGKDRVVVAHADIPAHLERLAASAVAWAAPR